MHNEKPQVFIDMKYDELRERVEDYDNRGWRFVNICGSTVVGGVELIYSFSQGLLLENLRFVIDNETVIPSVSDRFPNAFFFENETHDLFGVVFSDISIDFAGELYTVAVPTPMNPHSSQAHEALANNSYGAANYGECPPLAPANESLAKTVEATATQSATGETETQTETQSATQTATGETATQSATQTATQSATQSATGETATPQQKDVGQEAGEDGAIVHG
jgi:hypothetical protein